MAPNISGLASANTPRFFKVTQPVPAASQNESVDTYAPPAKRRGWHRTTPRVQPLRQGEQRAAKSIGNTIINSVIFGFFASCGAAAFNSVRGGCC